MQRKLPSSPFEHFARAIWLNRYGNYFGMFTLYCDASGGKDTGVTIVSHWLSEVLKWELLDADWRILLAKYHLPHPT